MRLPFLNGVGVVWDRFVPHLLHTFHTVVQAPMQTFILIGFAMGNIFQFARFQLYFEYITSINKVASENRLIEFDADFIATLFSSTQYCIWSSLSIEFTLSCHRNSSFDPINICPFLCCVCFWKKILPILLSISPGQ